VTPIEIVHPLDLLLCFWVKDSTVFNVLSNRLRHRDAAVNIRAGQHNDEFFATKARCNVLTFG
jgi:hypothetical protein